MQKQHLRHVAIVLERLGYQLHSDRWQLMWSHDYPFTSHRALMMNLKPYQKVRSCDHVIDHVITIHRLIILPAVDILLTRPA